MSPSKPSLVSLKTIGSTRNTIPLCLLQQDFFATSASLGWPLIAGMGNEGKQQKNTVDLRYERLQLYDQIHRLSFMICESARLANVVVAHNLLDNQGLCPGAELGVQLLSSSMLPPSSTCPDNVAASLMRDWERKGRAQHIVRFLTKRHEDVS
eukprot:2713189-Amphidinium_carterae.1